MFGPEARSGGCVGTMRQVSGVVERPHHICQARAVHASLTWLLYRGETVIDGIEAEERRASHGWRQGGLPLSRYPHGHGAHASFQSYRDVALNRD